MVAKLAHWTPDFGPSEHCPPNTNNSKLVMRLSLGLFFERRVAKVNRVTRVNKYSIENLRHYENMVYYRSYG